VIGADFDFIDFRMRWQDKDRPRPYVLASWLMCAATLPRRDEYELFLIDNLHIAPVLMKHLFLRTDQKIVAHLGSHTHYFVLSHQFSPATERLHLWALRNYDALICEGRMTMDIVQRLLGPRCPPTYEVFSGPPPERRSRLTAVVPGLENRRLLFVGGGPSPFRAHYKGLDLMTEAFAIAYAADSALEFDVVGDWDRQTIASLLKRIPNSAADRIHFRGAVHDIAAYAELFREASLYLHCTRGDCFPGAPIEAMFAGLVPLISEWTGTRQIVTQISDRLVAPLDAREIARRILWYFALDPGERQRLSRLSQEAVAPYNQEAASVHYAATLDRICADLGLAQSKSR
jgi:glycosyltransferase involved in cell wall biosynthesis